MASAFVFAVSLGCVASCGRPKPTHSSSVVQAPTAKADASAELAPPVTPSAPIAAPEMPAPAVCDDQLARIESAVADLDRDPTGAQMSAISHPIAAAYTALLRHAAGDEAGSSAASARVPEPFRRLSGDYLYECDNCGTDRNARSALALVHETTFWWGGNTCPRSNARTWCGMFERYPREALAVFSGCGPASSGGEAADQKAYCVRHLFADQKADSLGRAVEQAIGDVRAAIYAMGPLPAGRGVVCATDHADDAMRAAIFSPVWFRYEAVDTAALEAGIRSSAVYVRDFAERLAHERKIAASSAAVIARAICSRAEHEHIALESGACLAIARTSTERALEIWLADDPYAQPHYGPHGEIVDAKPWRK